MAYPCPLGSAGEIHELKEDLNHNDADMRKESVKKVIAGMTVGKDVSVLFPDVIKCMQVSFTTHRPHRPQGGVEPRTLSRPRPPPPEPFRLTTPSL